MQCESKTTKKAWRNPLAPMARCSREAKVAMSRDGLPSVNVCELHARGLEGWGWVRSSSEHGGGDAESVRNVYGKCRDCGATVTVSETTNVVRCAACRAGQAPGRSER